MSKFTGDVKVSKDGNPTAYKMFNLPVRSNDDPKDGDLWRADNTNTGLKIRINGVTRTITTS